MAVPGTSVVGMEGPPVRRLFQQEAQDPPGRNMSPQTRGAQNGSPGPGKNQGPPPTTTTTRKSETDTPENPRPPGFEIPFWIFGKSQPSLKNCHSYSKIYYRSTEMGERDKSEHKLQ